MSAVISKLAKLLLLPNYDPYDDCKDCYYDDVAGEAPISFIQDYCTHVKGDKAGEYIILEDWQKCMIRNLFGWKRPDGTRRFRELFLYIPRKNGKTFLTAAILLYIMFLDGEIGAEIYTAAVNWEQAGFVFNAAKGMIRNEPDLLSECELLKRAIRLKDDHNFVFTSLTGNSEGKHGLNIHVCAVDELHEHKDWSLIEPLVSAMGSRKQPLSIFMTTADFNRVSPCNEKLKLAQDIANGVKKDYTFLPVVYEVDKDEDWKDPKVWEKANPNLGVSIYRAYLEKEMIKAINSPSYVNTFKRLYLNIQTDAEDAWLPLEMWKACTEKLKPKEIKKMIKSLKGETCFAGLDIASNRDFTALELFFPKQNIVLSYFFLPETYALKYAEQEWQREGHIILTPGDVTDDQYIRKHINKLARRYHIKGLAYDRWSARSLINDLIEDGLDCIEFLQGFAQFNDPIHKLEKLIITGKLKPIGPGAAVLQWMFTNLVLSTDSQERVKFEKKKAANKIDGIIALCMAIALTLDKDDVSCYEKRDILAF